MTHLPSPLKVSYFYYLSSFHCFPVCGHKFYIHSILTNIYSMPTESLHTVLGTWNKRKHT